jgi:hypothetical protein
MKPAEHRKCDDASFAYRQPRIGDSWAVRARSVVEPDELVDDPAKVTLAQDEDVIENLSSERSREAFSKGVHVGARTAVRMTRAPDEMRTPAKRLPSLLS